MIIHVCKDYTDNMVLSNGANSFISGRERPSDHFGKFQFCLHIAIIQTTLELYVLLLYTCNSFFLLFFLKCTMEIIGITILY